MNAFGVLLGGGYYYFPYFEHFGVQEKDERVKSGDGIAEDYHRGTHRSTRTEQAANTGKGAGRTAPVLLRGREEGRGSLSAKPAAVAPFLWRGTLLGT